MGPLMPYTADELLDCNKDRLQRIRGTLFLHNNFRGSSKEFGRALLDFCVMLTMVQDMRAWSKLSEPGIAALMMGDDDEDGADEQTIEEARELDRLSIESHSRVAEEFQELGGKVEFQKRIDHLNELGIAEGIEPTSDRENFEKRDYDDWEDDDDEEWELGEEHFNRED